MKAQKTYFLGLDIGTDSIGYAVTNKSYDLLRFHGDPAWGVTVFDEAALGTERRAFRTARRRLDRRQQRVDLIQELFAPEIAKIDERFYLRLKASAFFREDVGEPFSIFNDTDYSDADYYRRYPTIHHLISDLMANDAPHDVRLVYLACAWLVAHRGHFLSNMDRESLSGVTDFNAVYDQFISFFTAGDNEYNAPWEQIDVAAFGACLKKKMGVNNKYKELVKILCAGKKPKKLSKDEDPDPAFPFSLEGIIKLLAGGTYALKDLFGKEAYADLEIKSVSLGMEEEKFAQLMGDLDEDYDLLGALRTVYDWAILADVLGESDSISSAKVKVYDQHKEDLKTLKHIIKTYLPKKYAEVFRAVDKTNYAAYAYHSDSAQASQMKKVNKEDFSKYLLGLLKNVSVSEEDAAVFSDMISRLELRTFLPKQKDTDNRVIPHQLYWHELHTILNHAAHYLKFLTEADESGKTVSEKIESVFLFRIPYFVGPLNEKSDHAWIARKAGKIYPWNFEEMVDLDESENRFIKKMTNKCTYLPGEDVLPKDSLLYHKFTVLNEINNLTINGRRIPVALKQEIYTNVFLSKKKVTRKYLLHYLIENGIIEKGQEELVSGIDVEIKSNLVPQIAFGRLMHTGVLTQDDVEAIIERASYAEDKMRLSKWIQKTYPQISDVDRKYICSVKIKEFGRLSRKFLEGLEGVDLSTGEVTTVISALWNTQNNLMEIIADETKYTFKSVIDDYNTAYYADHKLTLNDRLDEMYISNAVRRPVFRTLAIVKDIEKAFGAPEKIFIEMTRGGSEDQKGKRTKSRKQQILDLYEKCKDEDVRLLREQLEAMGDAANNKLQGDKLFLYYMQLGKCMYSGKPIKLENLGTDLYDIDHIYPQAYVKDDSILNNKVLVTKEENGKKSDRYPISDDIRKKMRGYWDHLLQIGMITEEKHKRLTRATPFTEEEKYGFINRQLTETSQSAKAVATLLKEHYPKAEIVYCKARLASDFRQEFEIWKSRSFNDLHHAVDAYLNIVTGNVYHMKFTRKWFRADSDYSIKTSTLYSRPLVCAGETVWDGAPMLAKVKATAVKNTAHFTKFAFFKKGGFFDQMPVAAAEGLVPRKKNLPTEKYGGYNKPSAMFFIPVRYQAGKKSEIIIMSVELLHGQKFLADSTFAQEYTFRRLRSILGKQVDAVSFPMGMRPWKVNTMLSLDGFRVCIAGSASRGRCLIAQPIMQFSAQKEWVEYVKKLERFVEKTTANPNYVYDAVFDKVTAEKNAALYDLYLDKLENSIYAKRVNCPVETLRGGRDAFLSLDIKAQAKALMNIQQIFGRIAGGIDLTAIGGAGKAAATVNFSTTISNWAKNYRDVRLIDASPSGLWKKRSDNLLELL